MMAQLWGQIVELQTESWGYAVSKAQELAKHAGSRDMSPALIEGVNNPVRRQILRMFSKKRPEWSPVELSQLIPGGLSQLSYHMKVLRDRGILIETRTKAVRGSTQHFYNSAVVGNKIVRVILAKTREDDKDLLG